MLFEDRIDAGRRLADRLTDFQGTPVRVFALPTGAVAVAVEIARRLAAPLDVVLVRRLPVPGHEQRSMGAVAQGGVRAVSARVVADLDIPDEAIAATAAQEEKAIARQGRWWPGHERDPDLRGTTAILVDDGLASGPMVRAALVSLRLRRPARIVAAVPVCAPAVHDDMVRETPDVVHVVPPRPFRNLADWYGDVTPVDEGEMRRLLEANRGVSAT